MVVVTVALDGTKLPPFFVLKENLERYSSKAYPIQVSMGVAR
jgi:hypothetical protein